MKAVSGTADLFDQPKPIEGEKLDPDLGQWMTPTWAAEELIDQFYGDLTSDDCVLEPSCGKGAFLAALPSHVDAMGIEIDSRWADLARKASGRKVITGNFLLTEIAFKPTVIIGNPPFTQSVVQAFLERAWNMLPSNGQVGFILPCYIFQTASVVSRLSRKWGMTQSMIPRNLFEGLRLPLCFAQLFKAKGRGLVGFALYHETEAVREIQARYRNILEKGERSVWAAVVTAALEVLGGEASLSAVYAEIEGHQPTRTAYWREKVRQTLQRRAVSRGSGRWALQEATQSSPP